MPNRIPTFGFRFRKQKQDKERPSIAPPESLGDTQDVFSPTPISASTGIQLEEKIRSIKEWIDKYRWLELQPEADEALRDIIDEAIVCTENKPPVAINTDNIPFSDKIKKSIEEEFEKILNMLSFTREGRNIFRRWYVDGRLTYHIIIDIENSKDGIQELRYLDPRNLHKIREIQTEKNKNGIDVITNINEYYQYESPLSQQNAVGLPANQTTGFGMERVAISPDSILFVPSGVTDRNKQITISFLHKAIKPMNVLRMIEDAAVIYRIARAPERRVFYVDVGNLPRNKAKTYLNDIMKQYRNKQVYDAGTGELKDDKRIMSILEDFWLPRREGSSSTEISTLPGGTQLDQIEDIRFFERKLYKALNVPVSRLESEDRFNIGRASEITRDELRFARFINKLQSNFNLLFLEALKIQLKLKNIISDEDWEKIENHIFFSYSEDSYFSELKEMEIIRERLNTLRDARDYVGKENGAYLSKEWVKKHILQQTDEEIKEMKKQTDEEEKTDPTPETEGGSSSGFGRRF